MKTRLLAFFDPDRSMALFVIGTAALTVFNTVLYDTIKESLGLLGAWLFALALLTIAVGVVVWQTMRSRGRGRVSIAEEEKPDKRSGLILLVSPHPATAVASINYHLETLQACWLVASSGSMQTAQQLHDKYQGRIEHIFWGPDYEVDPDQVNDTYEIVCRIFDKEAPNYQVFARRIIADITGGLKPMTAGMSLACLARNRDIQYMKAQRDAAGEPDRTIPPEPVKIDISYQRSNLFDTSS